MASTPKTDMKAAGISPYPDPPIRTLKVELLSENSTKFIPMVPNAREPTPFETEFFKGIAMIVIRTAPIDKNFECYFVGRRRLFEVQVQGKFKREPAGEIYVGAEATAKMELGLITRSISIAAMKLCSQMVTDMHYSFGDSADNPNHQLPHVVGPIFPTMDKIIVTPPGETPPRLGIPFTEDLDYRKARLKFKSIDDAEVKLDHTYSLSVNTSNLNLLDWTLVNIPMVKPMDLRTFFGSSSIQLVGYEMPRAVCKKVPNAHPHNLLNYVFCMKLTPVDPDTMPLVDLPIIGSDDEDDKDDEKGAQDDEQMLTSPPVELAEGEVDGKDSDSEDSANEFVEVDADGKEMDRKSDTARDKDSVSPLRGGGRERITSTTVASSRPTSAAKKSEQQRSTVGNWLRKKFARINPKKGGPSSNAGNADDFDEMDVNESTEAAALDWDAENLGDLSFCPGCIELNDSKKDGKGRYFYFLPVHSALETFGATIHASSGSGDYDARAPRIKSYSEIAKILPLQPLPKLPKNRRLSALEKRRRQIVESYRQLVAVGIAGSAGPVSTRETKVDALAPRRFAQAMGPVTEVERNFLNGNNLPIERTSRDGSSVSWEGAVAIALSKRHYLEQSMVLSATEGLCFRRSVDSRRTQIRIPLDEIVSVQPLAEDLYPLPDFAFLQVETFARVYYVMLRSTFQVNEWIPLFSRVMGRDCMISPYRTYEPALLLSAATSAATLATANASLASAMVGEEPNHDAHKRPAQQSRSSTFSGDLQSPTALAAAAAAAALAANNSVSTRYVEREEFYLAKPACWKLDKRRVFNHRRIYFRPLTTAQSPSSASSSSIGQQSQQHQQPSAQHPCDVMASILSAAFYLSHVLRTENTRGNDSDWVRFWDELSLLQTMSLTGLSEVERMSFFLNLYHVMVLHGSMVFGPPPAWNHWNAFFNQITYVVSGELVSIAEIEYCILRSSMSRASMFTAVAMPAPPTTVYPSLGLNSRDFRLHFAINCGSLSMLEEVPIYTPELLDHQLDEVTKVSLESFVEMDVAKKVVVLPKLPLSDYFSVDSLSTDGSASLENMNSSNNSLATGGVGVVGGSNLNGNNAASVHAAVHCLYAILPYLSRSQRSQLKILLSDPAHLTVKYRNYNFKCRALKKLTVFRSRQIQDERETLEAHQTHLYSTGSTAAADM